MGDRRGGTPRPVPSGTLLVKDIAALATHNDQLGEIDDAAIYVKGNVVEWVGKTADLPKNFSSADTVLSLKNRVVVPGLVNTHHHMFQALFRCIAHLEVIRPSLLRAFDLGPGTQDLRLFQDSKLFGWLTTCYYGFQHLTGADVNIACKTAMAELILSGCTTTSDHHYLYPNDVLLDDCIRAAREIGIRFHPTRGAMSLGKSKGGLPPDSCCEAEAHALEDMKRLIEEYHDNSKYSMLRIGLAPCSPFTVTNDLMRDSAVLARKYEGVRLHTHLAENQEDIDYSLKVYGVRPGDYIKEVGWDKADCWFAHCCMLDDAEAKLFARNGIGLAHCPSSNMRLASGIAPVRRFLDTGVNVGLGVDGSASNDCGHLMAEARLALFLQRSSQRTDALTCREALKLAVQGGAKNLGRDDIGQIAPGFAADFVAWRTDTIGFAGGQRDKIAGLLLLTPSIGFVDLSVINGEIIVQDGVFKTVDLQALAEEHTRRSEALLSHLPEFWRSGPKDSD